ncbi:uncharacterized protein [Lolium perenne]|uniref:uncharacterized protein n=1 Tax=Lolium perenne TaxID=4522 RepID=UPI0021F62273|nr:uncharacterized protein LOC127308529 [Lolium perenne]
MTRESMTVCLLDLQDLENSMRRHAIVDAFQRHILHMWLFCVNQDSIVVHDALEDITQVQATSSQQAQRSMSTNRNKQTMKAERGTLLSWMKTDGADSAVIFLRRTSLMLYVCSCNGQGDGDISPIES